MSDALGASFADSDPHGVTLDCGSRLTCQILFPGPGLARVVFRPASGFRQRRSWMTLDGASELPWEGRERLDLSRSPTTPFTIERKTDRLLVKTAEITVEIGLAPLRLRWILPDGTSSPATGRNAPMLSAGIVPPCFTPWRGTRPTAITGSATKPGRSISTGGGCAPS